MADLSNFVFAEDSAHTDGDRGLQLLTVRQDTAAALGGTDADYQPLITDASGRLHIAPAPANGGVDIGDIGAITGSVTPGVAAANLGKAEDALSVTGDTGVMALAVRQATATDLSVGNTDGDYEPLQVDASGRLHISPAPANVGVDIGDIGTVASVTALVDITGSVTPGVAAANLGKAEDAAHSSGDTGVMMLGVRNAGAGSPTNPATLGADGTTATTIAVATPTDVDSIESGGKKVTKAEIWSTVAFKVRLYLVNNAVEDTNPFAVGGAPAFTPYVWDTPQRDYVELGVSGGLDAFRAEITNLDDSQTADFYVIWSCED